MEKVIYFDMDGTLADLYNEKNWLADLLLQKTTPYDNAKVLPNREKMLIVLKTLKEKGYTLGIISWLSKVATEDYKNRITQSKRNWLNKYFLNMFDEMHFVEYGTPKHTVAKTMPCILVDDDSKVKETWEKNNGIAIDARDIENLLEMV